MSTVSILNVGAGDTKIIFAIAKVDVPHGSIAY